MDLLMNILETPTEEQLKCEYCHPYLRDQLINHMEMSGVLGKEIRLNDGIADSLLINTKTNEIMDDDYELGDETAKINFCPMCGRKFGDE
ncbi:hypothetical protein FD20_GL001144 [Liquorilactobacillus uvarum DSM 19971]|uniref:Uncharacterized protein n=2 Tax=Liquorilactobacillus uvarum TaxID=303240 RepID=A0A0R1Q5V8_9LACO|nr:hypothetical protein FD20_GL001144 [Liquorilactobacillus uvarum DSM 19971]